MSGEGKVKFLHISNYQQAIFSRYSVDGKTYSFNCLFISMKSQQQSRIPLKMAVLNLVHELMHAFGAQHDPDAVERAECTPANSEEDGRFLMSKYSNNGRKHNLCAQLRHL